MVLPNVFEWNTEDVNNISDYLPAEMDLTDINNQENRLPDDMVSLFRSYRRITLFAL